MNGNTLIEFNSLLCGFFGTEVKGNELQLDFKLCVARTRRVGTFDTPLGVLNENGQATNCSGCRLNGRCGDMTQKGQRKRQG